VGVEEHVAIDAEFAEYERGGGAESQRVVQYLVAVLVGVRVERRREASLHGYEVGRHRRADVAVTADRAAVRGGLELLFGDGSLTFGILA